MTQDRFYRAFALLRVHEGGYSNHKDDPGGPTMKGVTQRTYDNYRTRLGRAKQDVRKITDKEVEAIYRGQYWNAVRADELPPGVAYCVFDAAVNSGPGQAVQWLQQVIGARVDGVVGNETLALTRAADPFILIEKYCDTRLAFMKRLKNWSSFKNGWSRRVAEVRAQSKQWASGGEVPGSHEVVSAKADGPISATATLSDMVKDPASIGALGGLVGSVGAVSSGSGPVQYAVAAVLVLAALVGVWFLVRGQRR